MKSNKVLELLKTKDLIIPGYLIKSYKSFNLTEKELLFLSALTNENNELEFNPEDLSNKLSWDLTEIMEIVSNLCEKKYLELSVKKEGNKLREYLNLDNFYEKLLLESLNEEENIQEESKIYNIIETELGRTMSPIEYETISGWLNANIPEELIKEALKEAVLNGVGNLKYIDKILCEWTKKGYKKASDLKKKKKKEEKRQDLFEYDWLDEKN